MSRADPSRLLLGAHRATVGGAHKAFDSGMAIGCQAIQIFTTSPQQWAPRPFKDEDVERWHAARAESSVEFVVAHDSYLINLASPDAALREKSIAAFTAELERCGRLGIERVVSHPGAHVGAGEEAGLRNVATALRSVYEKRPELTTRTLLEITAGPGTALGSRFEHLGWLAEAIGLPERIGVCLDTCHLFAAGYDQRDPVAYARTMAELEAAFPATLVEVIHLNDSKGALGSHVDRHEQIGQGGIGDEGFRSWLTDPRWAGVPMLVETPDLELHGPNLRRLRRLARGLDGGYHVAQP